MKRNSSLATLSLCVILNGAAARAADTSYHFIKEIPVGGSAQWDYLKVDPEAHRLYLSHATKVEVIDLDKGTVIGAIENTPGVHGIALAPKLGRAFTSNGQENKASIVDLKTLKTIAKVTTGANPDSILYEPVQNEVYTFNGKGKSATVFHPRIGQGDRHHRSRRQARSRRQRMAQPAVLYVNIEDKSEVAVIDTKSAQGYQPLANCPGETASGMAIDLEHHRLFLGCDNKKMVMMDSATGKVVATVPIGAGVDANAFDPGTQLAFSSNGEDGNTTIAKDAGPIS